MDNRQLWHNLRGRMAALRGAFDHLAKMSQDDSDRQVLIEMADSAIDELKDIWNKIKASSGEE